MSLGNVLLNSNKTGILCKCHYGCSVNALLLGINIKWFSYINLFTQGAQYFWQQISDMEGSFKDVLTTVQFINSFLNRKQCLAFYIFKNIDKATKTTTKKMLPMNIYLADSLVDLPLIFLAECNLDYVAFYRKFLVENLRQCERFPWKCNIKDKCVYLGQHGLLTNQLE